MAVDKKAWIKAWVSCKLKSDGARFFEKDLILGFLGQIDPKWFQIEVFQVL